MEFKKLTLVGNLSLSAVYDFTQKVGDEEFEAKADIQRKLPIHNDLRNTFSSLRVHVCRVAGLMALDLYKPEEKLNPKEKEFMAKMLETLEVESVEFFQNESDEEVVITAHKTVLGSKKMKLKTPKINLNGEEYGYEKVLRENILHLKEEAELYMEKNKSPQLALEFSK